MNRKAKGYSSETGKATGSQGGQRKRAYPYRGCSTPRKDSSANKRLWMLLYGEPERNPVPERKSRSSPKDGELFG